MGGGQGCDYCMQAGQPHATNSYKVSKESLDPNVYSARPDKAWPHLTVRDTKQVRLMISDLE